MPYNADSLKKTYEAHYKKQRIANLIELREEIANLSLTDFSKQIGIQKSNLSSLEKEIEIYHYLISKLTKLSFVKNII